MQVKKGSGFTLIELMIVICIMAILAALIFVNLSAYNGLMVRFELHKLYCTCLYLQKCAQSTHERQLLVFDIKNNSYSFKGHIEQLSSFVQFNIKNDVKGPPSHPVNTVDKATTFENQQIIFYPDGIVQAGTIYLTDKNNRSLYALSSGVSKVSFLRKYHYDNGWHLFT